MQQFSQRSPTHFGVGYSTETVSQRTGHPACFTASSEKSKQNQHPTEEGDIWQHSRYAAYAQTKTEEHIYPDRSISTITETTRLF